MSKSETGSGHALLLTDDETVLRNTIKRATTDSGREIAFSEDADRAGVNNLLTIYQLLSGKDRDEAVAAFADARGYGDLKARVADVVWRPLPPSAPNTAVTLRIRRNWTGCWQRVPSAPAPWPSPS